MNKKLTLLKYLVPIIMLFFFVRNIVLVETEDMDSWMGGGMRMFGKIDKMLYRVSGFNVKYNNKIYFVNLRNISEFEDEDVAARILPNDDRLQDIINKAKQFEWCYNAEKDIININDKNNKCDKIISNDSIANAIVYKTSFVNKSNKVHLKKINSTSNEK